MEILTDILQSEELRGFLLSVITIIVGAIAERAAHWFNAGREKLQAEKEAFEVKNGVEQTKLLEQIAMTAVRFIQQRYYDSDGQEKLQEAIDKARNELLNKYNIEIGGQELEVYIEAAYNQAKEEFKRQTELDKELKRVEMLEMDDVVEVVEEDPKV